MLLARSQKCTLTSGASEVFPADNGGSGSHASVAVTAVTLPKLFPLDSSTAFCMLDSSNCGTLIPHACMYVSIIRIEFKLQKYDIFVEGPLNNSRLEFKWLYGSIFIYYIPCRWRKRRVEHPHICTNSVTLEKASRGTHSYLHQFRDAGESVAWNTLISAPIS
jgi:hypothetical protein